ncbi:MAG TPA: helix-turn-helix domain-containing protein [Phycisphaerales bacterium]
MASKPQHPDKRVSISQGVSKQSAKNANDNRLGRELRLLRSRSDLPLSEVARRGGYVGHAYLAAVEGGKQKANTKLIEAYVAACGGTASVRERLQALLENPDAVLPGEEMAPDDVMQRQASETIREVIVVASRPLELQDDKWLEKAAKNIEAGQRYTYFLERKSAWIKLYRKFDEILSPMKLAKGVRGILVPPAAKPLLFRAFGLCIFEDSHFTGFEGRPPLRRSGPSAPDHNIESLEVLDDEFARAAFEYLNTIMEEIDSGVPSQFQGKAEFVSLEPPVDRD